ncbi:acyl-CoA dehydrogenase family protein [Amycolatopsis sp. WQ 127309]|uniref:acyl-CoA dehydrogenase family protein n=1 Tax=Amycolatopsis sp. WQ 127309 TaxID=2932773 RepID=UPI001FF15432|nr:acyl-CoA dehydrogenase family protein [Amycolatopsis sp. WQ 127309]UOZ03485.1 acyl-CoA dehydrogenase family protein [Amycolatopsis sp. WQ 127309]
MPATHTVFNQVPPLHGRDVSTFPALLEGLRREGAAWAEQEVRDLGALAGGEQAQAWSVTANEHTPVLRTHDRYGVRVDEVDYDRSYHDLLRTALGAGLGGAAWTSDQPGVHVARAAKMMSWSATDFGHLCPVSMAYAVIPALRANPELSARYEPLLTTTGYDPRTGPPEGKRALMAGMSMTEKQGGSDVRANTTTATPAPDGSHRLIGHKWFTSAPMSDFFLTLAQAPGGLSCFLVPRVLADGTRNAVRLQRLKDKLGNRSNASAEIEYDSATGWLVGEEGRGVRTIVEMVNLTRLDCSLWAAAGMRIGTAQALHHASHRHAFGAPLVTKAAMTNVLADLAVDSEAATTVVLRLAGAVDRAARGDAAEAAFRRFGLAVTKYWLCKRWATHSAEALECLGGNGYIEESGMPRLYREAPLMSIWEGSGNVAALDALRAMRREPETVEAFFTELGRAGGCDSRYDDQVALLAKDFADDADVEYRARGLVERAAILLQAAQLLRHGDPAVAEAFTATRLDGRWGHAYGTLPTGLDTDSILERAAVR